MLGVFICLLQIGVLVKLVHKLLALILKILFGLRLSDLLHLELVTWVVCLKRVLVNLSLLVLIQKELIILDLSSNLVVHLKLGLTLNVVQAVLLHNLLIGQILSTNYARLLQLHNV